MTTALTLTYGATTVNLNDAAGIKLAWGKWVPKAGAKDDPEVTESIELIVTGANIAAIVASVRSIELAMEQAPLSKGGPLYDRVYINLTLTGQAAQRSRVMEGRVNFDKKSLSMIEGSLTAKCQLAFTRVNYWEGALATMTGTNRAGTGASAAIVNHQDAGATDDFYVEFAAAQVGGILPTPARIEFANTTNIVGAEVDHLLIGHFVSQGTNANPAANTLVFEATGSADAACSAGDYDTFVWADALENAHVSNWVVDTTSFRQRHYKMVLRLRTATAYTDLFIKLKLVEGAGTTVMAETKWTLIPPGKSLVEIGSLQIPPYGFGGYVDMGDMLLQIYEKRAAGAGSLEMDYIAAIPQSGWRKFRAGALQGLVFNETLTDDPIEGTLTASTGRVSNMLAEGEPIMLQPGVKNILYFLHDLTNGAAPIDRTATVVVKYRPRVRTL